jgi:hypothetical protein
MATKRNEPKFTWLKISVKYEGEKRDVVLYLMADIDQVDTLKYRERVADLLSSGGEVTRIERFSGGVTQ